jgi:hypothetical protein
MSPLVLTWMMSQDPLTSEPKDNPQRTYPTLSRSTLDQHLKSESESRLALAAPMFIGENFRVEAPSSSTDNQAKVVMTFKIRTNERSLLRCAPRPSFPTCPGKKPARLKKP